MSGSMTTWNGMIMDATKTIYTAVAHFFLLLRLMTHAAIAPNKARRISETIVTMADVPNAYQNWKFELLTTAFRFVISWENDAPAADTGFATIAVCFLNEFMTTR